MIFNSFEVQPSWNVNVAK